MSFDFKRFKRAERYKKSISPKVRLAICGTWQDYKVNYRPHWTGLALAAKELCVNHKLFYTSYFNAKKEIKKINEEIVNYNPTHILYCCKDFLKGDNKAVKEKTKAITAFWLCDFRPSSIFKGDTNEFDIIFLSYNPCSGLHQNETNASNSCFMPQGCKSIDKYPDVRNKVGKSVFVGAFSSLYHKDRFKFFNSLFRQYSCLIDKVDVLPKNIFKHERLHKDFVFRIKDAVYNNIEKIYGSYNSSIGHSLDFSLYTSNRLYIAMGCGSYYIFKKFKDYDRIIPIGCSAPFETVDECSDYIYKSIYEYKKCKINQVRKKAFKFMQEKHTYTDRLANIISIMEGKSDDFWGYI